jgi:hypothetical protein
MQRNLPHLTFHLTLSPEHATPHPHTPKEGGVWQCGMRHLPHLAEPCHTSGVAGGADIVTFALTGDGLTTAGPVGAPSLGIVSKRSSPRRSPSVLAAPAVRFSFQAPLQPAPRSNSSLKVPVTKMGQARANRRRHRANFEAGGTTRQRHPPLRRTGPWR